jgi:hypothetical protein
MLNDFEVYLGRQICNAVGRNETVNKGLTGFVEIMGEERW